MSGGVVSRETSGVAAHSHQAVMRFRSYIDYRLTDEPKPGVWLIARFPIPGRRNRIYYTPTGYDYVRSRE